jgi:hypothetical protein
VPSEREGGPVQVAACRLGRRSLRSPRALGERPGVLRWGRVHPRQQAPRWRRAATEKAQRESRLRRWRGRQGWDLWFLIMLRSTAACPAMVGSMRSAVIVAPPEDAVALPLAALRVQPGWKCCTHNLPPFRSRPGEPSAHSCGASFWPSLIRSLPAGAWWDCRPVEACPGQPLS